MMAERSVGLEGGESTLRTIGFCRSCLALIESDGLLRLSGVPVCHFNLHALQPLLL